MGTATEIKDSRAWQTEGRDLEVVERHFLVEDELPWEAHANAVPTLPRRGDVLPTRLGYRRGDLNFQVREILAKYATPGDRVNSIVIIIYRRGPDWRVTNNKRQVLWSNETSSASVTVYTDIEGNYVPEGLAKPVPITTIRARCENAAQPLNSTALVGMVNQKWFRLWPPHSVMFVGVQAEPVIGLDPYRGGATLEYEWQARPDGWNELRPKRDVIGRIVLGSDGKPVMIPKQVVEEADFAPLFPTTYDAGPLTFYRPNLPILP